MTKETGKETMPRINVTKTFLPPLHQYISHLEGIWNRGWITNHGPLVTRLEQDIKDYLGVKHLFLVANGTIALQIAIKALDLKGEVITTAFSYAATTASIVWENCHPVFVDIELDTLTIDTHLIQQAITNQTSAIMATHVYGNPCNIEKIQQLAKAHNLKVIYDAAHAFGGNYRDTSILNFGDISTLSFHATKLFHTAEGGAVVCEDEKLAHRISYMRNFGHKGEEEFWGLGINGKMSELHAAMGMCILPEVEKIIAIRRQVSSWYDNYLMDDGSKIRPPVIRENTCFNFAYYPVIFSSEQKLKAAIQALNEKNIFPRRYFFPPLHTLNYVCGANHGATAIAPTAASMPVTEDIARRVMCLPLYMGLRESEVKTICDIIKNNA